MGKHRTRSKKLDLSRRLSDDVLRMVLDELAQPDVLSVTRVCQRWRGVARRHPNYYRLVRYCPYRGGSEHFVSALRGAAAASQRVAVSFDSKDVRAEPHERAPFIDDIILPAVRAALEVTKKLSLVVPDAARGALYACLSQPAPLLEELHLELKDPWQYYLDDEGDETAEDAIRAEAHTELPVDFLGAHAPRLRSVSLSGVRMGTAAVHAFSQCRRLLFSCTTPIWRLHLGTHFPAVVHLELTVCDPSVQENIPPHALGPLPESLSALVLYPRDELFFKVFGMIDFSRIRDLRVWHEYDWQSVDLSQGAPYMDALKPCKALELRVFFEKTCKPRSSYRLNEELPAEVRVSLADRARGVVRTFFADEELYDAESDLDERFEMFRPFAFLTAFAAVVSKINIAHDFLPLLYQHFASSGLPALSLLEIDLDEFRGPFWVTESTKECGDYSDGDRSPPAWPTASKPKRRRWPGERRRRQWSECDSDCEREDSASDSSVSCDDEGYTREESSVLGTLEACGLLNCWDEEPDRHSLRCAALTNVRLRTAYEGRAVQSRQLAHFGRSLGFLERAPQERPQLLLHGVRLASAKYGKLHLQVFSKVIEEPVVHLKKKPESRDGYISPAYESYSDEGSEASD